MARLSDTEFSKLRSRIAEKDHLRQIVAQVEHLHRVVFHADRLDPAYVHAAAEEIVIADLILRHGGDADKIYYALRAVQESGRPWDQAINEYAAYIHNYYTTPLGVVIRKDLIAERSHFVTPAAGKDSPLYEPLAV